MKNKLLKQILKFGIVGGISFIIEYIILFCLKEFIHLSVLLSVAIAFSVSVVFNYIGSIRWVFNANNNSKNNFILFIILSIIGLVITEIIMWIGNDLLNIYYLIVKILATSIVMVFNFIMKKKLLEKS